MWKKTRWSLDNLEGWRLRVAVVVGLTIGLSITMALGLIVHGLRP